MFKIPRVPQSKTLYPQVNKSVSENHENSEKGDIFSFREYKMIFSLRGGSSLRGRSQEIE